MNWTKKATECDGCEELVKLLEAAGKKIEDLSKEEAKQLWDSYGGNFDKCVEKAKEWAKTPEAYCAALAKAATGKTPRELSEQKKSTLVEAEPQKPEPAKTQQQILEEVRDVIMDEVENFFLDDLLPQLDDKRDEIFENEFSSYDLKKDDQDKVKKMLKEYSNKHPHAMYSKIVSL